MVPAAPQLVTKNMHEYKIQALLDLVKVFREAGKAFADPVFAAGIGNRLSDAMAYRAAGIPPDFIFIIDTDSNLQARDELLIFCSSSSKTCELRTKKITYEPRLDLQPQPRRQIRN